MITPQVIYETVRRMRVTCPYCHYEWVSESQAEKRMSCSKCKSSLRFKRREIEESVKEESKMIMRLEPVEQMRYFMHLARVAKTKGLEEQWEFFVLEAHKAMDKELERVRNHPTTSEAANKLLLEKLEKEEKKS